jgi:hypothetical protein
VGARQRLVAGRRRRAPQERQQLCGAPRLGVERLGENIRGKLAVLPGDPEAPERGADLRRAGVEEGAGEGVPQGRVAGDPGQIVLGGLIIPAGGVDAGESVQRGAVPGVGLQHRPVLRFGLVFSRGRQQIPQSQPGPVGPGLGGDDLLVGDARGRGVAVDGQRLGQEPRQLDAPGLVEGRDQRQGAARLGDGVGPAPRPDISTGQAGARGGRAGRPVDGLAQRHDRAGRVAGRQEAFALLPQAPRLRFRVRRRRAAGVSFRGRGRRRRRRHQPGRRRRGRLADVLGQRAGEELLDHGVRGAQ